jgi:hypothetical protein
MNPPFHPPSVCPSANLSPFHLPHTETRQWGPHPSSVFTTFMPPLGHSLTTGAPVSVFCTSFPHLFIILLYKHPLFPTFVFVVTVGDLLSFLATRNPCHPWLESPFSFSLILTSSISSEHNPGLLPLSSAFIYFVPPLAQLTSDLVVPMTLDLVSTVAATPYIIHPPTKGSLESSHFLASSIYLCLLIPSVDSMEYLLLLGVASPFCRHQHTFPKGRQYLGPHFPSNERSRTAQEETP